MRIRIWVETKKINSRCEKIIEIDDDLSDDEITEIAEEEMYSMMEWDWEELDA